MASKRSWRNRAKAAEKAYREDYLHTAVHDAEHEGLAQMARNLLSENSSLWDDWIAEHQLVLKLKRKLKKLRGRK